jgi:hypothetical protein
VRPPLLAERGNALGEVGAGSHRVAELLLQRLAGQRVIGDCGADLPLHRLHRRGATWAPLTKIFSVAGPGEPISALKVPVAFSVVERPLSPVWVTPTLSTWTPEKPAVTVALRVLDERSGIARIGVAAVDVVDAGLQQPQAAARHVDLRPLILFQAAQVQIDTPLR